MADDEHLLELLENALAPESRQPPAERVAAVRHLAERGRTTTPATAPMKPRHDWPRRAGWLAAGVSVAAAAVVIALLALPTLVGPGRQGGSDAASGGLGMPQAVALLRVALMTNDPVAVARADANLLRNASSISAPEHDDAVAAHVEAIQFLRDHPSADAVAELPAPSAGAPTGDPSPVATTIAPTADPGGPVAAVPPAEPVPTSPVVGPPNVAIVAVVARLDGTFKVDFTVTGFTPDATGAPGSRYIRFTFDDGQSPTVWDGPSPWSFPVTAGLTYRQVCAHVADATGIVDPSTGGCQDIV